MSTAPVVASLDTNAPWVDVPGGDIPLDQLFPADGGASVDTNPPAAAAPAPAQPQTAPQTPTAADFYLKSGDGKVVYRTREDAERGISEKDRLIEQLRQDVISRTGVDPVTKRPVTPQQPQGGEYTINPDKYWDDLAQAASRGDKREYARIQGKYNAEVLAEMLAPLTGLISGTAREQALTSVSAQFKDVDVRGFVGGGEYQAVLQERPLLAQAIKNAEENVQYYSQLPELYRMAFEISQYRKQPALLDAVRTQSPAPSQPVRPTAASGTPPAPTAAPALDTTTKEGRTEYLKQMESGGIRDIKF